MVRGALSHGVMARVISGVGAIAVAALVTLGVAPAAQAAPKPAAKPTSVQIVGKDIDGTLIVDPTDGARLFDTLLAEVTWMATATPQTTAPAADKLGPKYSLTVMIKTAPQMVYDLYPLAAGGPRAHRPAKQPVIGKTVTDGWFYGRLTMSETLRVSGVPLEAKPDVVAGGIGGGIGQDIDSNELDPVTGVNNFLGEMRRVLLVNGAVLAVIAFGLAGIAFLIRRKV
ncbi:hypothetical protein Ato02nite_043010 [Paractinoplanes toevensis]|uniref:Uncharacterized protein n=1 Tax=Paractinoplanes toevensis TaxID=571911 RepID=A0A919W673_9ACTN|nr:hypothetical protein Ato02nite_043010 [Actinoplanes toevensis]